METKLREFLDECKAHNACATQYKPALRAFKAGDYELVMAIARGSRDWLEWEGVAAPFDLDNGRSVSYYTNGQMEWEGEYVDGKWHGRFLEYYENGQVWREGEYVNGKPHGRWVKYYGNGRIQWEGEYVDGEPNGRWVWYYENGRMQMAEEHVDGKLLP